MSSSLGKSDSGTATPAQPYGLRNGVIWWLPFDSKATGSKFGDIIAEVDRGYLIVTNADEVNSTLIFIPKAKVQE